jgi:hypothetical protein
MLTWRNEAVEMFQLSHESTGTYFFNDKKNVAAGFIPAWKPARILIRAGINPATTPVTGFSI